MRLISRMRIAGLVFLFCAARLVTPGLGGDVPAAHASAAPVLSDLQRNFMQWRFGMFVHFNLGTVADIDWAGGYEDPLLFHPAKLDCGQWADEAKAAGMTYLVLTVKHTEGIALYDSRSDRAFTSSLSCRTISVVLRYQLR